MRQQPNPASEIRRQASGSFRFVDPGSNHPITVWFCRTSKAAPDTRIVFVMHGSDSQTARQACDLASPYIEPLNAIVLAPQFAEEYFPGDAYMFGNMLDAAGNVRPKSAWALTAIDACSTWFAKKWDCIERNTTSSDSRVARSSSTA